MQDCRLVALSYMLLSSVGHGKLLLLHALLYGSPVIFMQFDDLAKECKSAKIQAFPAWIVKGQTYSGAQTFDKLEKILDSQ